MNGKTETSQSSTAQHLRNTTTALIDLAVERLTPETHDTWRIVVYPSLIAGRPWSNEAGSSAAWSTKEKIKMVTMVLEVSG